tara:strand:- start:516 stop:911 length:396 start_codon:yes stop_codon:yes gene_type:complete
MQIGDLMKWEDILKDWRRPFITSVIKRTTQLVDNLDKDVESWVQTPTSFEDFDQEGNMTMSSWKVWKEHIELRIRITQSFLNDGNFLQATKQIREIILDFEESFDSGQFPEVHNVIANIKFELLDADDLPE